MIIKSDILAAAIKQLKAVTPPTTMMKVPGILISDGRAVSTNGEVTVSIKLDIPDDERLVIPLPAMQMIDTLPPNDIEVKQTGCRIKVTAKGISSAFNTVEADNYPAMPDEWKGTETGSGVEINGDDFAGIVSSVLHAVAATPTRPTMGGVLLECQDGKLNAVACDGFRVAWNQMPCNADMSVIIPKAAMKTILSMGTSGILRLQHGSTNSVVFETPHHTIVTQTLSGSFVTYRGLFPKECERHAVVNREAMICSLARSTLISDGIPKVRLTCEDEVDRFNISAVCTYAEFDEDIHLEAGDFDSTVDIALNPKYVIEALKAATGTDITVQYCGKLKPIVLTAGQLKQLILPMRA